MESFAPYKRGIKYTRADLESVSTDDSDICGHTVTKLDLDDITNNQLFSVNIQLLTAADDDGKLQTQHSTHYLRLHQALINASVL